MSDFTDDHDPYTFRYLAALGVGAGWRCADVGAGNGSVVHWLLDRVGSDGSVLAVDVDVARLHVALAGTAADIHGADVTTDPLPQNEFDLVHSRLMLCNLRDRAQMVQRLVVSLRPGGWLVLGDLDFTLHRPTTPDRNWDRVWAAFLDALVDAGWDPAYGRRIAAGLEQASLAEVTAETVTRRVPGGSPPCRLTTRALANALPVLRTVSDDEVRTVQAMLADAGRSFFTPAFTVVSGRRT